MDKPKIIEKAIKKAYDNGWNGIVTEYIFKLQNGVVGHWPDLFSKDFAKALWGEKHIYYEAEEGNKETRWQYYGCDVADKAWVYRLKEMVVAKDPIKYLGDHLDD